MTFRVTGYHFETDIRPEDPDAPPVLDYNTAREVGFARGVGLVSLPQDLEVRKLIPPPER